MANILPNLHPIFVHFTVALLIIAAVLHLLSHFLPDNELKNQWTIVARWNLWIGVGLSVLTVAAGWVAFYTVKHDAPSHLAMIEHRNWAMATFAVFIGIAVWEYYLHRHGKGKGWLFSGLLVLAVSLLVSTAWHGGELVYRYGLGVMSMPKPESADHDHNHNGLPMPEAESLHQDEHSHAPGTAPHKD